jgi:uncharacterized membrane protein
MAALTGFVITVTVLVVQMATGTFSARYLRLWYRDRMLKATLAVLAGTLTFSFGLLRRIESDFVPNIGVSAAGLLVVSGLILFLIFFDRFIHRLRPVAVAALVTGAGRKAFGEATRLAARRTSAGIGTSLPVSPPSPSGARGQGRSKRCTRTGSSAGRASTTSSSFSTTPLGTWCPREAP